MAQSRGHPVASGGHHLVLRGQRRLSALADILLRVPRCVERSCAGPPLVWSTLHAQGVGTRCLAGRLMAGGLRPARAMVPAPGLPRVVVGGSGAHYPCSLGLVIWRLGAALWGPRVQGCVQSSRL